jgi:hypothetical protein
LQWLIGTAHRTPRLCTWWNVTGCQDEDAKEYWERNARENFRLASNDGGPEVDPTYTGKVVQLQFTVEDEGVFTTAWSATVT